MAWTLPTPREIADRLAAGFETEFARIGAEVDARGENAPLAILARVQALGAADLYLYQQALAAELLPDTAQDWLARHGDIWGVPQLAATRAGGDLVLSGTAGTVVVAGFQFAAGGLVYATTATAMLGVDGAATVGAACTTAGAAGSLAEGAALTPVTPLAGLAGATAGAGGLVGRDAEDAESWRARILARIRTGPDYGQSGMYERAARGVAGVAFAREYPGWVGAGSVGVVVAMEGPRAPTAAELAAVQAALEAVRPVTARVVAAAASLRAIDVTLALTPDTAAIRNAARGALALFFAAEAAIGGTLAVSRLDEAVSSAAGEYSHRRVAPAADIALGKAELAVLGSLDFAA